MFSESQLHDLIGSIYGAALDPSEWTEVVATIRDGVGGAGALLFEPNHDGQGIDFAVFSGLDPNGFATYSEHYLKCDVWQRGASRTPAGQVVTGSMLLPIEDFVNSEFYEDFLRGHDIFHLLGAVLSNRGGGPASMSIYRPRRRDDFDEIERSMLRLITPHLQRALTLHRRIGALEWRCSSDAAILDQLPFGVMLVGADHRVIFANRVAETIINEDDGVRTQGGKLVAAKHGETSTIRELVSSAAGARAPPSVISGGTMHLSRPSLRPPLQISVVPVSRRLLGPVAGKTAAVAVFVFDREFEVETPAAALRVLYGLTLAEARLVSTFVAEASLKAAAERLGISEGTARVSMKRVYAKTGVHSQAALMKLVLTGPAALGSGQGW